MKKIVPLFLLLFSSLSAGIEDYFSKIKDKSGNHSFANIDFIYVINLDKRPERLERSVNALKPYGISPCRLPAVNGWTLSYKVLDEVGVVFLPGMPNGPLATVYRHDPDGKEYISHEIMKEVGVTYYCHCLSRGCVGCVLSHLSCLQDAYDSGYNIIWVMEDDIKVVQNPSVIPDLIRELTSIAPNWDVLFTDNEIKDGQGNPMPSYDIRPRPNFQIQPLEYYRRRYPVSPNINKIGMRFGATSMIISRSGMKKLLDFFKTYKVFFPYDIDYFLAPDIQMYQTSIDFVTNISGGSSDTTPSIENMLPSGR